MNKNKIQKLVISAIFIIIGIILVVRVSEIFINQDQMNNNEKDDYINLYRENIYNMCQLYEDEDKKLDCYFKYDIRINESLEDWATRKYYWISPSKLSFGFVLLLFTILGIGLFLIAYPILDYSEKIKK